VGVFSEHSVVNLMASLTWRFTAGWAWQSVYWRYGFSPQR